MVRPHRLRLEVPRLDDVHHHVVQLAVLGLIRNHGSTLAEVEDVRLALDEVLLDQAILAGSRVDLDISSSSAEVVVEVVVHDHDVVVDRSVLSALVDDVQVATHDGATVVTMRRQWSGRSD